MRILFYRYGSICEPDIISALHDLGHDVYESNEQITNKNISSQEIIAHLDKQLSIQPVDCIFSINFYPVISEICNIYHLRYISWIVDSPVMELYATSITNPWNRIFLFDRALYDEFHQLNPSCIFHMPLAASIDNKELLFANTSSDILAKFQHDIAFVGSLYTEKCLYDNLTSIPTYINGYLNGLMNAQEKVYGYYFIEEVLPEDIITFFRDYMPNFYHYPAASYLTDRKTVAQFYIGNKISSIERVHTMKMLSSQHPVDIYTGSDTSYIPGLRNHGFAKTLTEMPLIFHESKINLNITAKAIRSGLPLRIWDILSSQGLVMTNYQPEINDYFIPGEDLVVYSSLEELLELTRYYLSHDRERIEIAHNGFEKLKQYHTYTIRLQNLIDTAFSY